MDQSHHHQSSSAHTRGRTSTATAVIRRTLLRIKYTDCCSSRLSITRTRGDEYNHNNETYIPRERRKNNQPHDRNDLFALLPHTETANAARGTQLHGDHATPASANSSSASQETKEKVNCCWSSSTRMRRVCFSAVDRWVYCQSTDDEDEATTTTPAIARSIH